MKYNSHVCVCVNMPTPSSENFLFKSVYDIDIVEYFSVTNADHISTGCQ